MNKCENCLGFPKDMANGCICEGSDQPGTYDGMVIGMRKLLILHYRYLNKNNLEADFEQWAKESIVPY